MCVCMHRIYIYNTEYVTLSMSVSVFVQNFLLTFARSTEFPVVIPGNKGSVMTITEDGMVMVSDTEMRTDWF